MNRLTFYSRKLLKFNTPFFMDFKFASFLIGEFLNFKRKFIRKWSEISLLKIAILKLELKKAVCGDVVNCSVSFPFDSCRVFFCCYLAIWI